MNKPNDNLKKAAHEYIDRRERISHPEGKFAHARRWYPGNNESRGCCATIRSPSRSYPFSLNTHCRSLEHISKLFNVSKLELRREVAKIRKENKIGGI